LITILAFIFVLGVLVFVHELGHFLAAKRVGIHVLKFQLGFNPTIASFKWGETEYGIGALPLGGYVKMAGENLEELQSSEQEKPVGWDTSRLFLSKTKWQRFQVLIMGPVMNLLLAFVLTAVVLYHGAEVPTYADQPPVVGVVAAGSPAAGADIRAGDRITTVAGHRVDTWDRFFTEVASRPNREVKIELTRDGVELTRRVTPTTAPGKTRYELGGIGVAPNVRPQLVSITPGDPGDRAGLKADDVILQVNGEPILNPQQLRDVIARHPEDPITLEILRSGSTQTVRATPSRNKDRNGIGWLGVGIGDETKNIKPTAVEAVGMSVQKNIELTQLIGETIWGLLTREISRKQLMGPIEIARLSGESAERGLFYVLGLMASLSLNLGLLNLMPIPVLDGGHILIMAVEGVARRDLSVRVKERMLLAGFVVLVMLMVTVIYNDLTRISWFERFISWR